MRQVDCHRLIAVFSVLLLICACSGDWGWAAEKKGAPKKADRVASEQVGRLFDIKVPEGFKQEASEEAGILKWKKGRAEIYLVVGDLFSGSGKRLYKALFKAAGENENLNKVRSRKIRGGKAFTFTEKPLKDTGRLRTMTLVVVTRKKVIHVDFTAPTGDFESLLPAFETSLKSFRLKSSGS